MHGVCLPACLQSSVAILQGMERPASYCVLSPRPWLRGLGLSPFRSQTSCMVGRCVVFSDADQAGKLT